jgi:hypothetical protein
LAYFAATPLPALSQTASRNETGAVEFFEKKIRPLLVNNCYNCHSANTNAKGGLRVDDRNGLLQGGGRGPAVVPGHPEKSLLLKAIRQVGKGPKMPPGKHLTPQQIADLDRWIASGAAWPKVELSYTFGKYAAKYQKLRKEHWAWQPLRVVKPPAVSDSAWPLNDVDRFLLAKLDEKGLRPVQPADRVTLLRRVTFDLTGLPPTPREIDAFLRDETPGAFAKVVDRLLASPAFGERWGRHWLDVARYGESTGSARNLPYPHAWRYRDYVIDAFNSDKPYNLFLREQIAGDLLPAQSAQERDQHLVATGFLALGVRDVNQRFKVRFIMDNVDEQIDTVSRAILGLTASCARCHDHKFDPIPQSDYYALAGIFRSTDLCAGVRNKMGGGGLDYYDTGMLLRLDMGGKRLAPSTPQQIAEAQKVLAKARAEFQALVNTPKGKTLGSDGRPLQMAARLKKDKLETSLQAMTDPAAQGPVALGVRDGKVVADTEIRLRGEAEKLGPVVSRGYLTLLDVPGVPPINPKQSGRLELAQWLTSPQNPLTPRVLANRVWQHLFGQGLVRSVDNFGVNGDTPSHPELLDYLAARFVQEDWSVKKLVRMLVLSRAYQLSAEAPAGPLAVDPANRLVWRHSPRRLEAEEIRDATLAAAGTLDLSRVKGSAASDLKVIELPNNGAVAKRIFDEADRSQHRSVYLPLIRTLVPRSLEVFDFAEQGMVTGSRDTTTVAPQALYLLNDPFVRQQALSLAQRLNRSADLDNAGRINLAYLLTLGRAATAKEIERARNYLAHYEEAAPATSASGPKRGAGKNQSQQQPMPPAEPQIAALASFCQALLASAEFRYVR